MTVTGVLESRLEPIRNQVTDSPHRASIRLPQVFDFREADMVSGSFTSEAPIKQDYQHCYGFLTHSCYGPYGLIEEYSHPLGLKRAERRRDGSCPA